MVEKILEEREDSRQENGRGDGVSSTGESMSSVQARQEEARRKRRRKKRSGSSLVSSCFQGQSIVQPIILVLPDNRTILPLKFDNLMRIIFTMDQLKELKNLQKNLRISLLNNN